MPLSGEILAWEEQLRNDAENFFHTAQEVADYLLPTKRPITTQQTPGTRKIGKDFDSTASNAVFLLCSFLSGALFDQSAQWFDIKHTNEGINANADAAEYFQGSRQAQLASFRQSNFYSVPIELITDWIIFGNMCVMQEKLDLRAPNYSRLVFTPIGFGSYVFFEGDDKRPGGLIRRVNMAAQQCVKKFGATCSEQIKLAAEKTPFRQFELIHSITPRDLVKYRRLATPKDMPWASCWFEAGKKNQPALLESGYYEKPFAIARYNVIAGETMGRGLGEIALPHVKTLNKIMMRGFIDMDKGIDPPIDTVANNIIGDYSHKPGSRNVLRKIDGTRPSVDAQAARSRNATFEWEVGDLRQTINDIFLTSQIRELIGIAGGPVRDKTAYQYSKELELLHLIMAPTGGRLQSEGLRDIVETNYAINFRIGALPELPPVLIEAAKTIQGNQTVVMYEGPLAQSQRSQQLGTMREFLAGVGELVASQLAPEAADIPDIDAFVRKEAEIRGIQYLLNDPQQTDEIRALKGQVQQLQQALLLAQQASEVMKNAAPMVTAIGNANHGAAKAA